MIINNRPNPVVSAVNKMLSEEPKRYKHPSKAEEAPAPSEATSIAPEPVKEQAQAPAETKRQEWKALEEARKLKAEAEDKLKKAEAFQSALNDFEKDPLSIAKARGMTIEEYVNSVNRAAMGLKTEKVLSPEEEKAKKEKDYLDGLEKSRKDLEARVSSLQVENWIAKNIAPVIKTNVDKFEFLTRGGKDIDTAINDLYGFMDAHYKRTGQTLDALEAASAIEDNMAEEYMKALENGKQYKKLQHLFAAAQPAQSVSTKPTPTSKSVVVADSLKDSPESIAAALENAEEVEDFSWVKRKETPKLPKSVDDSFISRPTSDKYDKLARRKRAAEALGDDWVNPYLK